MTPFRLFEYIVATGMGLAALAVIGGVLFLGIAFCFGIVAKREKR